MAGTDGSRRRLRLPACNALQDHILFPEFEAGVGPGLDVVAQGPGARRPVLAVDSAVGLRFPVGIPRREEAEAVEAVVLEEPLERLEGAGQQAAGAERVGLALVAGLGRGARRL